MPTPYTVTEQELAARAIAPRVSELDIEAEITSEYCFTAKQGVLGAIVADGVAATVYEQANAVPQPLSLLTICVLVLRNGYTVTGTSAVASPANFDADIGKRVARADAVRQVWPLLGYALRDRLHHAPAVQAAAAELDAAAKTYEANAPIHRDAGELERAAQSDGNAASCRAAIARLVP